VGTAVIFITYLFWGFLFGWAKPVPISPYYFRNRQRGMALVGIAGPLANFILVLVFAGILRLASGALVPGLEAGSSVSDQVFTFLFLFFQLNIVLGIFNLIPIPPLDGSRVLGGFLPRNAYQAWVNFDRYGFIVVIVFIFIARSAFSRLLFGAYSGLSHALIPTYVPYLRALGFLR
jgi:Zn-dependent protease